MNQFQLELVRIGIADATAAIDKACTALSAYERKPDPLLVKMAFDYMVTSRDRLHNPEIFVRIAGEDPLHDFEAK